MNDLEGEFNLASTQDEGKKQDDFSREVFDRDELIPLMDFIAEHPMFPDNYRDDIREFSDIRYKSAYEQIQGLEDVGFISDYHEAKYVSRYELPHVLVDFGQIELSPDDKDMLDKDDLFKAIDLLLSKNNLSDVERVTLEPFKTLRMAQIMDVVSVQPTTTVLRGESPNELLDSLAKGVISNASKFFQKLKK